MRVTSLQASLKPFSVEGSARTVTGAIDSSVTTVGRADTATERRRMARDLSECIVDSWQGDTGS